MPDIHSTAVLNRVVRELDDPALFFLRRFFPTEEAQETEEIHFDVEDEKPRITPFVSPKREGKVVENEGHATYFFKPAYVKDKRVFDPDQPLKRSIGEPIGGNLSGAERERRAIEAAIRNQLRNLDRREEVMASEILRTGKVTISGEGFPTQLMDFGRHTDLTDALTSNDRWSVAHADSDPDDDLQDWATLIVKNGGGTATDVVMEPNAWKAFRSHANITGKIDYKDAQGNSIDLGAARERGLIRMGRFDQFNLFVYQDWYETDAGVVTPFLPSGTVIMASGEIEGVQHFGAIRDPHAGYAAMPFFPRSWIADDPPQRMLMTQSAPLVVPYRANATLAATVL